MNESLVRKTVMEWPGILILLALIGVVWGLESLIRYSIDWSTVTAADQTCSVKSIATGQHGFWSDTPPTATIDCGGKEYKVGNADLAIAYLQKPQPLICKINQLQQADCKLQGP